MGRECLGVGPKYKVSRRDRVGGDDDGSLGICFRLFIVRVMPIRLGWNPKGSHTLLTCSATDQAETGHCRVNNQLRQACARHGETRTTKS